MSDQTFTQEQVAEFITAEKAKWETEILQPVMTERNDLLQFKPVEKSDAEKALEQREQELFKKEMSIELKAHGLEDFADFINVEKVDELKSKIESLNKILEARKVNSSYIPDDHKQTTAYDQAASKNDVTGMISAKLSKLFN
ncbi:hypothetical protein NST08_09475 [Paenibacillus sp. FSL K6-1566]|uniref:hypothetical protein n=1 Tax=Paenibacillus sp. FSL K6-1566 TaxID=2954515 RepID=UPI003100AC71